MSFLFMLIMINSILLVLFPTIFRLVFTYILGFSRASIKLKHPFKYVSTALELRSPIWGIEVITIFVPEIRITLDMRNLKFCIIFDRPKIMFTRSHNELLSLKIVDGIKENNLLYNLMTIINSIKQKKSGQKASQNGQKQALSQNNRFNIGLKAVLHFIFLIIAQFVQIKILNCDAAIVSPMSLSQSSIPERKDIRIQITLMESFAQYFLFMREFKISANLHDDHQVNIVLACPFLKLYTANHMEDVLVRSQNLSVSIRIPFTFSFKKSMERVSIIVLATRLVSQSTPVDFQNLSKILNQILFSQEVFREGYAPEKVYVSEQVGSSAQKKEGKKITVSIDEAEIKMTELCQQDEDTPQALKYLSNLLVATLKFQKVKLIEGDFTVNEASLNVKKYIRINQNEQKPKVYSKQVLRINNLLITKEQNSTKISHDDVKISCQRQQLALLGKLFTLINSRVIIDQYDQVLYMPFIQIARAYALGKQTLAQTIQQITERKYQSSEPRAKASQYQVVKHESSLIYYPKQIQFELDISELIHKIILYSSEYRQIRTLNGEINHQLCFKRITMEYKHTKEFQVNDFKLFYRQTEASNELELQVVDILMMQNYNTLKDYFIGFTMFKLMLQFASDQEEKQNTSKKSTKIAKKSLNFNKIVLNYATQLLTLRKLSIMKQSNPDGKLSSLYFSLSKCDFSVQKLYQTNRSLKYYMPSSHNLLSVASVTVKQFLTSVPTSITPKKKYMINIKNPIILLPQIDISDRLLNYVKTFNRLQPSLQIFMNNTTDQQIRLKRRKYKIFMIDTDVYMIKITKLLVGIEDSVFDRSMLNRMRFNREYLERKPKYNESEVINYLKQTVQVFNLFEIQIQSISIDIKPLQSAGNNEKSVKEYLTSIRQKYAKVQAEEQQTPRLIRVNNFSLQLDITDFQAKIRDYPFNIMSISKVTGNLEYLKTKNIYEETLHYVLSNVDIDEVSVQIGLSLLSGIGEIMKKMSKYRKSMDEYKNTEEFLHTVKTKSSVELSSFKPYWHILHKSTEWHVVINKESQIKIKLMTGLTPYSKQNLSLRMGALALKSNPLGTQFSIKFFELTGNKLRIFQIGRQKILLKSIYDEPHLILILHLDIESQNNTTNTNLKDNTIRVSEQIIRQLWKIKQLRTDWLLIYGLVEPNSKRQQNVLKREEQSSYVELFKMAANMQLKNRDRELSIFSVLKEVKFYFNIDKFALEVADQNNQIGFIISNFNFSMASQARAEKWKMRHFLVSIQNAIGRLKIYRKKQLTLYETNHEFLQNFNSVTEDDIKARKQQSQTFRQIFLVCRSLKVRINEYVIINDQIVYIQKKLEADSLKLQLTNELKKIIDSLFISIFKQNKQKVDSLTKNSYYRMSATQKLRETVVLVIRANRKKKNFCDRLKMYINFKSVQIGFKTPKKMLLLTNGKPTCIKQNLAYKSQDLYHVDPMISVECLLENVEIWVSTNPNHMWLMGKGYSPAILSQTQRILKCNKISFLLSKHQNEVLPPYYLELVKETAIQRATSLHVRIFSGLIQLTRSNIEVLKEIGEILITIVNSKEQKRKEWCTQKEKYSQMISNGRQTIKTKLSWKYSDQQKGPAPVLESKVFVTLDKINIILLSAKDKDKQHGQQLKDQLSVKQNKPKYPFMNLVSSDIQMKIEVYNQENLKKEFKINNLTILNCLQPEDSNFRILFEMNHVDSLAFVVKIEECLMSATNPKVLWTFFKSVYINFYPIKVKFTQQLYNQIYYFFFGIKPETDERDEQLSNILPDYYLSLVIDEVKVQAWYRTPSILKRLEGVSVGLEKYEMKNQFLDNKTLFDRWVKFLMKQLASQFFNVLGQKLFG